MIRGSARCRPGPTAAAPSAPAAFAPNAKQPDGTPFPRRYSGWPIPFGLSSKHPGGVQVALADDSVRFVAETVDFTINCTMAGIQDGKRLNFLDPCRRAPLRLAAPLGAADSPN